MSHRHKKNTLWLSFQEELSVCPGAGSGIACIFLIGFIAPILLFTLCERELFHDAPDTDDTSESDSESDVLISKSEFVFSNFFSSCERKLDYLEGSFSCIFIILCDLENRQISHKSTHVKTISVKLTLTILALGFRYYKETLFVDHYILHYLVYYDTDREHNSDWVNYDRTDFDPMIVSEIDPSYTTIPFDDIFGCPWSLFSKTEHSLIRNSEK